MTYRCGIILTTYNDLDLSKVMHETLKHTMHEDDMLVVVDAGSSDGSADYWSDHCAVLSKQNTKRPVGHLSVALNVGIEHCVEEGAEYVCWIHADMRFDVDALWLTKLIDKLSTSHEIGKIHPECINEENTQIGVERSGNNCPWVMNVDMLASVDALRKERGGMHSNREAGQLEVFNEAYVGIGGREDWDVNNYVLDLGLGVIIYPEAVVYHEGMGTRKRRDTNREAMANAELHYKLHGTTGARV